MESKYEIHGFLVDAGKASAASAVPGAVEATDAKIEELRAAGIADAVVAVGDCRARMEIGARLSRRGFRLAAVIHPRAVVAAGVNLGAGTVVAAGAVINPGARVGSKVIINTGATIDHECIIEDGAHVSPGAHLGGRVRIGTGTWVGIGASIIQGIHIGNWSMVGAGAVVVKNLGDNVMACGVPAKVVKDWPPAQGAAIR